MKQASQAGARAAPKKHVILFLAANSSGTDRLALDREARSIHAELKRSGFRDRFDFVTRWAAEPLDLLREVRELRPTVVHFSGHGGARTAGAAEAVYGRDVVAASVPAGGEPHGLSFHDPAGGAQVVSPEAIAQTLGAVGASVKVIVLNACFTAPIAETLLVHVDCVVGMSGSIHDDAARSFAIGFYGGLGERESIAAAFEQGRAAINLEGLRDAERPQLKVRDGFDATQLILAAVAPSLRLDVPCPYPGMRPYTADDAQGFHGRAAEIDELIGRLRAGEREIYVIGPSGSGKSSLVAAGVLPRLARGVAGLGPFVVLALRPGEQPAARLYEALDLPPGQPFVAADCIAALLAHRGRGSSVLLVVDQLEELFTLASVEERDAFLAELRELRAERRCAVIVTLRADFFGALMESPLWPERRGRDQLSRIEVSPLRGQALRDAIAAPARDAGVVVEPELIERLLADAASEPGILPLLQETMVQLWDARADQRLTLADYQALGDGERSGLAVALARRADATLRRFNAAQMDIARRISLRLISFGEGRSDTRRQQPRAKLRAAADDAADFAHVLKAMVDDRLLTIDEDDRGGEPRVDLAHEVMIGAWPALASWIRSHRVDEQRRRQFEAAATQWVEHGRGARGLLDPIEQADAEAWQQTESAVQMGQSAEVMALIAASRAAHRKLRRRQRSFVCIAFSVLSIFVVIVSALAVMTESRRKESQRRLALSYQEAGRQLMLEGDPLRALPYLLAARTEGEDGPSLRMLFRAVTRNLPLMPPLEHQGYVVKAVFDPSGTRIVTASGDGTACVWDATTGQPLTPHLEHQAAVTDVRFSPDGTHVVTASNDGTARIWDAVSGELLTPPLKHRGPVTSAAFNSNGTRIVTTSMDKTARVWNATTGEPATPPFEHQDSVREAAFSPDGTRIVTASNDGIARIWDAATGQPLTSSVEHRSAITSAAFSSDGTRIVTASYDHTARVWDAVTGKPITPPLGHQDSVSSAAFNSDGTRIVTASMDKTARVWDATTGKPLTPPLVHQASVTSAAFSPDGTCVVTASMDKTARVWDTVTGRPLAPPIEHRRAIASATFSPDGTRIVTASWDNTSRIWDATTSNPILPFEHQGFVRSASFSPNGTRVVTTSYAKTARVWDTATQRPITSPLEHDDVVSYAAFSPDGMRVVTASLDKTARVWDATTGKPISPPLEHHDSVSYAAFSPDGMRIVTASEDNTARVWDATTGKPITPLLEHHGRVSSATFSPDGMRVITSSFDKTARVWDATTGKPLATPFQHQGPMSGAAFSPDGTRVVTSSRDGSARVWNAATGEPITPPLEHASVVWSATFSPDGMRVVTASEDDTAQVWDATSGQPLTPPLVHQHTAKNAIFSADGTRILTVSTDNTARIWDAMTGKPLCPPLMHQDELLGALFTTAGMQVVTATKSSGTHLWNATTGKPLALRYEHSALLENIVPTPDGASLAANGDISVHVRNSTTGAPRTFVHPGRVLTAVFSPDGMRVVTASDNNTAYIWDTTTGKRCGSPLVHKDTINSATFSPDGRRVVTASDDNAARIWDSTSGTLLGSPLQHQGAVGSARFSPDGRRIVTASRDNTARVWDATTGRPLTPPLVHHHIVWSAAFSPDGLRIVTASWDVRVWDATTGEPLTPSIDQQHVATNAGFSPDGSRIVTAGWDYTARVWDAITGKPLTPSLVHQGIVRSVAFSPDGSRIVTASADATARVWDSATGMPLTPPLEHQDVVISAAFSPDGSRVVTASTDKTARVWDAITGKPLTSPLAHQDAVLSATFNADGSRVVTASGDKTARIWDVSLDNGTLAQWSAIAERSPYILVNGVLSPRPLDVSRSGGN